MRHRLCSVSLHFGLMIGVGIEYAVRCVRNGAAYQFSTALDFGAVNREHTTVNCSHWVTLLTSHHSFTGLQC